ncbi:tripartite tricarboxylate transporter substrate binding protein [Paralimibaculum aggregatum]|uniref:Tripartite tricarboxylate transporter substrate binding protein n=1 Tax=Paralimibaculum aggregatum TaxID=3036245 RepID=A0ABQ6LIN7_9RHOB|nr:tripartite tricarboxylate transporter substrate binding protein [Limibaculum sp. NKW23]GMG83147.1 tripartite tricarboxylate transporter substrate binding protein [Limibaculum sp. NKW23]
MKRLLHAAAAAAALLMPAAPAAADGFPARAIEDSVFASPGGATDFTNRLVMAKMEEILGTTIAVQNRTGGGGAVAMHHVWSRPHDGYSLLGASEAMQSAAVLGFVPWTSKDWHWFMVAGAPGTIAVRADSPYQTLDELIAAAKANPGTINVAHANIGSVWHLKALALARAAGVQFNSVPYEGSNPAQIAALSGEAHAVISGMSEQAEYLRGGEMRALAVIEMEPFQLDDIAIPAAGDSFPDIAKIPASQWVGFAVPADIPAEALAVLNATFDAAMQDPELRKTLTDRAMGIMGHRGETAMARLVAMESAVGWTLQDLGIAAVDPASLGIAKP